MRIISSVVDLGRSASAHLCGRKSSPKIKVLRQESRSAAIVFVHGFTGRADSTWEAIVNLLVKDNSLRGWDIYSIGYASNLRVDIPNLWSADPDLNTLAAGLSTTLSERLF